MGDNRSRAKIEIPGGVIYLNGAKIPVGREPVELDGPVAIYNKPGVNVRKRGGATGAQAMGVKQPAPPGKVSKQAFLVGDDNDDADDAEEETISFYLPGESDGDAEEETPQLLTFNTKEDLAEGDDDGGEPISMVFSGFEDVVDDERGDEPGSSGGGSNLVEACIVSVDGEILSIRIGQTTHMLPAEQVELASGGQVTADMSREIRKLRLSDEALESIGSP